METIQFEAIKTGLRQSKDGYTLSLVVHPDDLPDDLMRDFVGSRYMIVMVRIGDDEQPVDREEEFPGDHAVRMSGMVCREPEFWEYASSFSGDDIDSEEQCALWLCEYLGIESRKELKTDSEARELFTQLRKGFNKWKAN
jgi:hypothetical protein